MRTTILLGPPGCGKTTSLLDKVEEALAAGVSPSRIAFFAFTRRAAEEAISRAVKRFNCQPKDLPWFRTLHSAAFRILGLRRDDVMTTANYHDLGARLGSFTFSGNYNETTERPPRGGGLGDRALSLYSLARARGEPVELTWRKAATVDINLRDALRFSSAITAYKKATGLLDFSDFLDRANGELELDLLIIDEAQDLTHQQWEFARRIGRSAKQVIIAGDDDQCIFQWAGADLRTFLAIRGNMVVLPKSYRLPRTVWEKAVSLSKRIKVRREKIWEPREEAGSVNYLDHPDQAELRGSETWLLLTRHRHQIPALAAICRDQGVVYQQDGWWSNQHASVRGVVNYERLRAGEALPVAAVSLAVSLIPGMSRLETDARAVGWDSLAWPFSGRPDWMEALTGLGGDQKEYIRRLRREGESLSAPGRVVISTIHGSKGGEADNVVLLPDLSARTFKNQLVDPDQEVRVFYVGTSRARHGLHLVRPRTRRFFQVG